MQSLYTATGIAIADRAGVPPDQPAKVPRGVCGPFHGGAGSAPADRSAAAAVLAVIVRPDQTADTQMATYSGAAGIAIADRAVVPSGQSTDPVAGRRPRRRWRCSLRSYSIRPHRRIPYALIIVRPHQSADISVTSHVPGGMAVVDRAVVPSDQSTGIVAVADRGAGHGAGGGAPAYPVNAPGSIVRPHESPNPPDTITSPVAWLSLIGPLFHPTNPPPGRRSRSRRRRPCSRLSC